MSIVESEVYALAEVKPSEVGLKGKSISTD
jgi:hypothetical protein